MSYETDIGPWHHTSVECRHPSVGLDGVFRFGLSPARLCPSGNGLWQADASTATDGGDVSQRCAADGAANSVLFNLVFDQGIAIATDLGPFGFHAGGIHAPAESLSEGGRIAMSVCGAS